MNSRRNTDEPLGPTVRRTRKGSAELVVKQLPLDEYQRQILLYANGRRSIEEISEKVPMLRENQDLLIGMEEAGLIELIDPEIDRFASIPTSTPTVAEPITAPPAQPAAPVQPEANTQAPVSSAQLNQIKSSLNSDLVRYLGSEADGPIQRVEAATNAQELQAVVNKLTELINLYSGKTAAERFAARYKK